MADDYEIGYGRPPRKHRWPKGVSGNPKGREKGHKGLKTDFEAVLNTVSTLENRLTGKKVKGRNQRHAVERLVERAAMGDLKAQALLFPLAMQMLGIEDRNRGPRQLSALDREILDEALGALLSDQTKEALSDLTGAEEPPDDDGLDANPDPANDDGDEDNDDDSEGGFDDDR